VEIIGYTASVLVGLSLGLIGSGGSILTVPILVYFFGIDPLLAGTYSLFVVGITSASGLFNHLKKGNVDLRITLFFGLPSLLAVLIMRRWIMPAIPHHLINIGAFAVLLLGASIFMINFKDSRHTNRSCTPSYSKLIFQSLLTGIITGFVGVGGGFIIIPSLILFAGLNIKKAIGTSVAIVTISSLLGVLGDVNGQTFFDYRFLASFSVFAIAGIMTGIYLSKYISNEKLKLAFASFLLLMGTFILINTLIKYT